VVRPTIGRATRTTTRTIPTTLCTRNKKPYDTPVVNTGVFVTPRGSHMLRQLRLALDLTGILCYDVTMTFTVDNDTRQIMLSQIGRMNVLAISGGWALTLPDGVDLPVGGGYHVYVRYTPSDDYTVERVFLRGGVTYSKGIETMVYAPEVGETAYRASCFRNDDAEYWPAALDKSVTN
jgi:hypothetical protein